MTTPQTDLTARLLAKLHEWGDGDPTDDAVIAAFEAEFAALAGAETPQGMDEAPSCPDHGVMVATNEHGFACVVCQRIACDVCRTGAWCDLAERCLAECLPTDEDAPLRAVFDGPEPAFAAPPPAVDPPALVALVREYQDADRAYNTEAVMRGGSVLTATHERFMRAKRQILAWTPDAAAPPVAAPAVEGEKYRGSCEGCPYPDTCSHFNRCTFRHVAPPLASGSAPAARPAVEEPPCPLCGGVIEDGACLTCRVSDVALTSRPWGTGCHHCDEQPPDQWCWWCGRRGTGSVGRREG